MWIEDDTTKKSNMIDRILTAKDIYNKNRYKEPKFIYLGYSEYQELLESQDPLLIRKDTAKLQYLVAGLVVYVVNLNSHFHVTG